MTDYPAAFGYHRKFTVLPPSLQMALKALGEGIAAGVVKPADVAAVVDGMCALPVKDFSAAYSDVASCAGLYAWQAGKDWTRVAQKLMKRTPGLEFVMLFHSSGYLRQAALEKIEGVLKAPFLLAAVMYRLNDWVPEVRRAAVDCTLRVFQTTPAPVILPAVIGMLGMRFHWKRGLREALIVDEVLSRDDVRTAMLTYLLKTPSGPVARTLGNLLRDDRFDAALPSLAHHARNPSVRRLALDTLIRRRAQWPKGTTTEWIDKSMGLSRRVLVFASRPVDVDSPLEPLIRQGASDRSTAVRKVAMQALVDRPLLWAVLDGVIATLAVDSSAAIREGMAYIARQRAGA